MSRREVRDSDSKRHRSRFDREPSPKRPRRDGKPATERPASNLNLESGDHSDRDQKHHRRLQDALPLEPPLPSDPKVEVGAVNKETDKKTNGHHEGTKHSSDPTDVPRSRSFFQHDERGNARQVGRSLSRRDATEHGGMRPWRDSKDQQSERVTTRTGTNDTRQRERDEKSHVRGDENRAWRHDGFFEMEANPKLPARKRPSFRENKVPLDSESVDKAATEPVKPSHTDRPALGSERREERGGHNPRHFDRPEKPLAAAGERDTNRSDAPRSNFSARDRYDGSYRGGERFSGRQGYRPSGVRVEKWKHDLFDEANRSPTPKNEEDQIAKVEALLSS